MKLTFTSSQLITILVLSRLYTLLTFTTSDISFLSSIVSIFISIPLQLIILLHGIMLIKRTEPNTHLLLYTQKESKLLFYIFGLILSVFFIFMSLYTVTTFEDFLMTTLYPRQKSYTLSIAMLVCVWITAYYGLPSLLRMSRISSFFIGFMTIIMLLFAFGDGSFYNIRPVIENPVKNLAISSLYKVSRNLELLPLFYLGFTVKDEFKYILKRYFIFTSIILAILLSVILYVLGDYITYQLYPLYTLTSFINVSIFQRLDSFYALIWVVIAFIKISFYLLLAIDVLKCMFNKRYHQFILPSTLLIILIGSMIKDNFYSSQINYLYFITLASIFVIALLGIPLTLLVVSYIKNRRI